MRFRICIPELNKEHEHESREPMTLSDVVEALGLTFYRPCGGKGTCGNCMVCCDGQWVKGCKLILSQDCEVEIPSRLVEVVDPGAEAYESTVDNVAIDIGTTTICMVYKEGYYTARNSQGAFGADVVSRIEAAMGGQSANLRGAVMSDIRQGLKSLGVHQDTPITVSANTTMGHLLMGYSVDGLATFPFTPHTLELVTADFDGHEMTLLPGFSAYVGADIVSGAYALEMGDNAEKKILVDLGTNAEILLWDGKKYWATSASAGPALEVSSISCGSAVIDVVANLRKQGLLDEGGLYTSEEYMVGKGYPLDKNVFLSQEDVQQVLLAKSAIYSGIVALCHEANVSLADIDHLYVAGGLGAAMSPINAALIKLIPRELIACYEPVGNTSLKGAIRYANEKNTAVFEEIISKTTVIDLGNSDEFQRLFLESLSI